jgi:hypothetical protein
MGFVSMESPGSGIHYFDEQYEGLDANFEVANMFDSCLS